MVTPPFNEDVIRAIAEFRIANNLDWLNAIARGITELGDFYTYVAIVSFIYLSMDKRKGRMISYTLIFSFFINIILKVSFKFARPLTEDLRVAKGFSDYSTPSGHAQGSGSFWTSAYLFFRNKWVLTVGIFLSILVGLSRPYLGVHYFEDVIIGLAIGIAISLIVYKIQPKLPNIQTVYYLILISVGSLVVVLLVGFLNNFDGNSGEIAIFLGLFAGLALATNLEMRYVKFASRAPNIKLAVLRVLTGIILVLIEIEGLAFIFELIANQNSLFANETLIGYILRFVRYYIASLVAFFVAPWVLIKIKLATREETPSLDNITD